MKRTGQRILSILTAVMLIIGSTFQMGSVVFAEEEIETTVEMTAEETTEVVTEETVEEAIEENTEEISEETTEAATDENLEEASEEATEEIFPAFSESMIVDGVEITVSAQEGVFPEGAALSVSSVPVYEQQIVDAAVENERDADTNVAVSYTFDIKVLDKDGNEIQPKAEQKVAVSFAMSEAADDNLDATVYHVSEDGEAEALDTSSMGETVEAVTDGFSYYTVEFTYGSLQYVLPGGDSVELTSVLNAVGLSGHVTAAVSSAPELFDAEFADGIWKVFSYQAFTSNETLTVTINSIDYVIEVTDPEYYDVWVSGGQVSSTNKDNVLGDGRVTYDPETGTLFLDSPDISGKYSDARIYAECDLIIQGVADLKSGADYGILVFGGTLTITGSGDITARGDSDGIYADKIIIEGGVVTTEGGDDGMYADDISITGGNVKATGTNYDGIYADEKVVIDGGNVTAKGGNSGSGIKASHYITINDGTVIASGASGIYSESSYSYGSISITGGAVKTTGDTEYGIYSGESINISGGSVTAAGVYSAILSPIVVIKDGEVNATAANSAVSADTVTISGGTVNINQGETAGDIGIESTGTITITDGTTTVSAALSCINAVGLVKIKGGTVKASDGQYGIYTQYRITIEDGTVIAKGTDAGIYSASVISIDDGSVTAEGGTYGIYNYTGDIYVNGGEVTATGVNYGIYSGTSSNIYLQGANVAASGDNYDGIRANDGVIHFNNGTILTEGGENGASSANGIATLNGLITANGVKNGLSSYRVTIDGGTVKATGTTGYGIYTSSQDVTIKNDTNSVTADGAISAINSSYKITIGEEMTIKEPTGGVVIGTEAGPQNIGESDGSTVATHALIVTGNGHKVTFDANGHGTAPEEQYVKDGKTAVQPADLSATGYAFEGWYTDKDCSTAYDFSTAVTADITLYASWGISVITVTGIPFPVDGKSPVYTGGAVKETDARLRGIGGWYWYDEENSVAVIMSETDTFDAEETHMVYVYAEPTEGNHFASEVTATIDGMNCYYTYVFNENTRAELRCVMPVMQKDSSVYVVTAGALNVRTYPAHYTNRIGGLKYGDIVYAYAYYGDWVMTEVDGQYGWVNNHYLALTYSEDTAIKPIKYTVTAGAVNVRNDISMTSTRIGGVTYGKEVLVTGLRIDSNGDTWLVTDYPGDYGRQLGYLMAEYTTTESEIEYAIEKQGVSAEEDSDSDTVDIGGVDPKSVSMGGVTIWSRIAHENSVELEEDNYEIPGNGTYYTTIYPDDAHNYSTLSLSNITLPSEWDLEVMSLELTSDGGVKLWLGPVNAVKITFESNEGSGVTAQYISSGSTLSKPDDPIKEGYTFDGWFEDASLTTEFDFTSAITKDVTLYAGWSEKSSEETETIVYTFCKGADGSWTKGSSSGFDIVVNRNVDDSSTFGHFTGISVDGTIIDVANYTAESGSLKATLKPAYLETLSDGKHTLKVIFDDGSAETSLTIIKKAADPAQKNQSNNKNAVPGNSGPVSGLKTGDNSNTALWILLVAAAGVILVSAIFAVRRLRKN